MATRATPTRRYYLVFPTWFSADRRLGGIFRPKGLYGIYLRQVSNAAKTIISTRRMPLINNIEWRFEDLSMGRNYLSSLCQFIVVIFPRKRGQIMLACKLLMKINKVIAILLLRNCRLRQSIHLVNNTWVHPITSLISIH